MILMNGGCTLIHFQPWTGYLAFVKVISHGGIFYFFLCSLLMMHQVVNCMDANKPFLDWISFLWTNEGMPSSAFIYDSVSTESFSSLISLSYLEWDQLYLFSEVMFSKLSSESLLWLSNKLMQRKTSSNSLTCTFTFFGSLLQIMESVFVYLILYFHSKL